MGDGSVGTVGTGFGACAKGIDFGARFKISETGFGGSRSCAVGLGAGPGNLGSGTLGLGAGAEGVGIDKGFLATNSEGIAGGLGFGLLFNGVLLDLINGSFEGKAHCLVFNLLEG